MIKWKPTATPSPLPTVATEMNRDPEETLALIVEQRPNLTK